jgi:hypothetical protein
MSPSPSLGGAVSELILGLFGIGLLIRFGGWVSRTLRGPDGRRPENQRRAHHGRQQADDVPAMRRKAKDDDPALRFFE